MRRIARLLIFLFSIFSIGLVLEGDRSKKEERIAIRAEKIFTISHGIIYNGLIMVEKGKIVYVGPLKKIPDYLTPIEARVVIPGLIDTHTHLGCKNGWNEYGNREFAADVNPSLKILDVIDKGSVDFSFALSGGVTSVMVTPGSGNIICGELVVLKTAGDCPEKRILRNPAGLKMAFDSPQALEIASKEFEKAREYLAKNRRASNRGEIFKKDLRMETLAKVLKREIPAHIHCIPYYAIENALKLKKKFNIDIVIEHGLEADKIIRSLQSEGVPISCGPLLLKQAASFPDSLPSFFEKAGIKFSIHSDAPIVPPNDLLLYAAQAVKYGLSEEMALRAVTLSAAEILRIEHRVGSIETGKDADLVLLDGDPFDIITHVKTVFIEGKIVFKERDML